jgi:hypothetical protein
MSTAPQKFKWANHAGPKIIDPKRPPVKADPNTYLGAEDCNVIEATFNNIYVQLAALGGGGVVADGRIPLTIGANGLPVTAYGNTYAGPVGTSVLFTPLDEDGGLPMSMAMTLAGASAGRLDFGSRYAGQPFTYRTADGQLLDNNEFTNSLTGIPLE